MTDWSLLFEHLTRRTGIDPSRGGLALAVERYARARSERLGFPSPEAFIDSVVRDELDEFERLVEIVSVPHTWFFRDRPQMDAMASTLESLRNPARPLSIWVPGVATGEDAYGLALLCETAGIAAEIVASDLCRRSLDRAAEARYGTFSLRELPEDFEGWFRRDGEEYVLEDGPRRRVSFVRHNLLHAPLTRTSGWDLVLCRNVLIYFSTVTALEVVERIGSSLAEPGFLFVGAGELIGEIPRGLGSVRVGERMAFRRSEAIGRERNALRAGPPAARGAPRIAEGVAPDRSGALVLEDRTVERASRPEPLSAAERMAAGIVLYSAADYGGALDELRAALLLDDALWPAAAYLGLCFDALGREEHARTEFRHAAALLRRDGEGVLPESLAGFGAELRELVLRRAGA